MQNEERRFERIYIARSCWPLTRVGAYLCGSVWVLAGSVFLLNNLGLLPTGWADLFWPLLVIGIGLAYLGWARTQSEVIP